MQGRVPGNVRAGPRQKEEHGHHTVPPCTHQSRTRPGGPPLAQRPQSRTTDEQQADAGGRQRVCSALTRASALPCVRPAAVLAFQSRGPHVAVLTTCLAFAETGRAITATVWQHAVVWEIWQQPGVSLDCGGGEAEVTACISRGYRASAKIIAEHTGRVCMRGMPACVVVHVMGSAKAK